MIRRLVRWYWRRHYMRHPTTPLTARQFAEIARQIDWTEGMSDHSLDEMGDRREWIIHKRKENP